MSSKTLSLTAELKKAFKSTRGVSPHGRKIRVSFSYMGERRHETLEGIEVTVVNVKKAGEFVKLINAEIKLGKFDYEAFFPNSTYVKKLKKAQQDKSLAFPLSVFSREALANIQSKK